jgi:AcrR family transcriptional regulator
MEKRKYQLKQRAAQQQETRERIVDAAMALHEELGPAATTISALAERAGVQRLTVYRHFASDREILHACSTKWMTLNPPPDPSQFPSADSPDRARAILSALYRYYAATQSMWRSLYRDLGEIEALDAPMREFHAYLGDVSDALLASGGARKSKRLRATVAHAVRFSTWQSLAEGGLDPKAAAGLVSEWIQAVGG